MKELIEKYLKPTFYSKNHRYKSWEHCFQAFGNPNDKVDYLALQLAFYLASWGMYRGSSGLLWKDYKVHNEAVVIIKKHFELRNKCFIGLPEINGVLNVVSDLADYYKQIEYFNGDNEKGNVTATDTLISKIILGTLGCLPAFDRYFNIGIFSKHYSKIDNKTLEEIWRIANEKNSEIESVQEWIRQQTGTLYPPMKIIDMYFWQLGIEKKTK
jgi:hypothetical protein